MPEHTVKHTPGPQFARLKAEFDAHAKGLMLCIAACRCPTCGAEAEQPCRSKSGQARPTHVTRSKAGHALLGSPVEAVAKRMFDAMQREHPERIVVAIGKALAKATSTPGEAHE